MNKMNEGMLAAALGYAANGWRVLPTNASKVPMVKNWVEVATTDEAQIRKWWERFPEANVGIATGSRSGMWAVDIDIKNGKNGYESLQEHFGDEFCFNFDDELWAKTPSGGMHLFFRAEKGEHIGNRTNALSGVDIRGDGGYVVVAPSRLTIGNEMKEYRWGIEEVARSSIPAAPNWARELLNTPSCNSHGRRFPQPVNTSSALTEGFGKGSRDDGLFRLACSLRAQDMPYDEARSCVAKAASNCTPSFDEQEAIKKVDRAYDKYRPGAAGTCRPPSQPDQSNGVASATPSGSMPSQDATAEEWVDFFNSKHAVVKFGNGTYVLDEAARSQTGSTTVEFISFEDFKKFYSNRFRIVIQESGASYASSQSKRIKVAHEWLEHPDRRTYEAIVFDPAGEHASDQYNLWRGFAVKPRPGDASVFWSHIREVICAGDETTYEYVRKWMAHAVQKPSELPRVAIGVKGLQGTGKGTFVKYLSKLFHPSHCLEVNSTERLTGNFNGHLRGKIIVNANEAIWGGNKKGEGFLKALITDENILIELKGKESTLMRNYTRLVVTSNDDWFLPLATDDRRYVVLECSAKYKDDHKYFENLHEKMEGGGLEALMYDLQQEELAGWNPVERPAGSSEVAVGLKYDHMQPHEQFFYDWLQERAVENFRKDGDGREMNHTEFYRAYCVWLSARYKNQNPLGSAVLATKVYGKLLPIRGKRKGHRDTLYSVDEWDQLYSFYCKNVIHAELGWDE